MTDQPPHKPYTRTKNKILNICTFNVRTLQSEDRILELENALTNVNWDIIGLAEVRRNYVSIEHRKTKTILCHSAAVGGNHGVGFLMQSKWKNCIEAFMPKSKRIAVLKIKFANNLKYTIIQIHAPIANSTDEEIEEFYGQLQQIVDSEKNPTAQLMILGDWNARIGQKEFGEDLIVGSYGYGTRNGRGTSLLNFALENKLKITNTFFKQQNSKKWTWISPTGNKHQLDYILTKETKNIHTVETINIKFNSDHKLLRAIIQNDQKHIRYEKFKSLRHYARPDERSAPIYKDIIGKRLEKILENSEKQEVQTLYEQMSNALTKLLPKNEAQPRSKKLSEKSLYLLNKREELKLKRHKTTIEKIELAELRKTTRKSIRQDIYNRNKETVESILASTGSIKKMKTEISTGTQWINSVHGTDDNMIEHNRSKILARATEFYRNLYDSTTKNKLPLDPNPTKIPPILECEITKAMEELRTNKCPGEDNITNEMIFAVKEPLTKVLQILFNLIMTTEIIPNQWKQSNIILLHKKGDRNNINNYRPISLISNIYKIFIKTISQRMSKNFEEFDSQEQAGFRKSYSTIDHIHVLNQIIEKANEYDMGVHLLFIDFAKAFDSVDHDSIFLALEAAGIESKYINILKRIYEENYARVVLENPGPVFEVSKGVKQGDPISPRIFKTVLEYAFRQLNWDNFGINILGQRLNNLRFADDIVLLSCSIQELEVMLRDLNNACKKVGLNINYSKTIAMSNRQTIPISVDGNNIEYKKEYIYLGQLMSFQEKMDKELQRRQTAAWAKYWSLKFIFKANIHINLKKKAFDSCILPCLTYGCQAWTVTKKQQDKLSICQRKIERSMLGTKRLDKISNKAIRDKTKITDALIHSKLQKWKWAGHLARLPNDRWTKLITEWVPRNLKRRRGRQKLRWSDEIKKWNGINWIKNAQERHEWKKLGEAYVQKWTLQSEK